MTAQDRCPLNSGALSQVSFDFAMCLCMDELGGICIPEKVIVNKHQHHALPDYYLTSTLLTIMLLL